METIIQTPFGEVATLLLMTALIGFLGIILRQPLIVSFIAVGIMAGPSGLDLVRSSEKISLLSELGIAVLLFLVGIKLDLKLIRSLGAVSLLTGLGQVLFTSFFGYLLGLSFDFDHITSLYIAVALTFSSTIIIVKLLADKREIDSLHGQIALGFLIVQDLVVVLAMIVLSAIGMGESSGEDASNTILTTLFAGLTMLASVIIFIRYIASPLTDHLVKSPELLVIFAIAQAAVFAAVGDMVGLGKEVGGLLAGVSLASTPYRDSIAARLAPLRDFLLLFFFIALGSSLDLALLGTNLMAATAFSLFVLIGNPLIVLAIMGAMGYRKRTGFLAGLTVAQISEFSLIFITMGISLGHLQPDALGLVTLVGLVTIAVSTYMITYSHQLFSFFGPYLNIFERQKDIRESSNTSSGKDTQNEVIIFGLGRFGTAIGLKLQKRGISVLGIDFSPMAIRRWRKAGLKAKFGDASDPQFISDLKLSNTKWIVSTVPAHTPGLVSSDVKLTLSQNILSSGFPGKLVVTSHNQEETEKLISSGVDIILEPFQYAADQTVELLCGEVKKDS